MAEAKTKKNNRWVEAFLDAIENKKRSDDARIAMSWMEEATGEPPVMWGPSIIGFGTYTLTYASGKTADWMLCGLSPRKQALTLYIMDGFDRYDEILGRLGKYKTGKSCLYINKIEDIDHDVAKELIAASVKHMKKLDR